MEHQLTREELRNTKIKKEEFKNIERNNIYISFLIILKYTII